MNTSKHLQEALLFGLTPVLVACSSSSPLALQPQDSTSLVTETAQPLVDEQGNPIDVEALSTAPRLGPITFTGTVNRLPLSALFGDFRGFWRVDGRSVFVQAETVLPTETVQVGDIVVVSGFEAINNLVVAEFITTAVDSASIVTTLEDENGTDPADCSLREAIIANNTSAEFGGCADPNGTITFDPSLNGGTLTLAGSGLPALTSDVVFNGPGATQLTISGADQFQILTINPGVDAEIRGLDLADSANNTSGAAILNQGILTFANSSLTGNFFSFGVRNESGQANFRNSSFTGTDSAIRNINSTVDITNCTFTRNRRGVENFDSDATINGSTFSGSTSNGSAILNGENSTLTVSNSDLINNSTIDFAPAIQNFAVATISFTTISGNSSHSRGTIHNDGTMTIISSTLTDNSTSENRGGAINSSGSLTITNSNLSNNLSLLDGGAISSSGTLSIDSSIFEDNVVNNFSTGRGGAVQISGSNAASTIRNSTFRRNSTGVNGGAISFGNGNLTLSGNTFSDNRPNNIENTSSGLFNGSGNIPATCNFVPRFGEC